MSRIGKKPVIIPNGVKANFSEKDRLLTITGPKGELKLGIHGKIILKLTEQEILIDVEKKEDKKQRALWGLFRSLIQNLVDGVLKGFEKKLEVNGVGFKQQIGKAEQFIETYKKQLKGDDAGKIAEAVYAIRQLSGIKGDTLEMRLGFSHPVFIEVPKDISVSIEKNLITISGVDKQKVGQFASEIREWKKPEPYKGKGIKYIDEIIIRKAGKVVKVVGGGK